MEKVWVALLIFPWPNCNGPRPGDLGIFREKWFTPNLEMTLSLFSWDHLDDRDQLHGAWSSGFLWCKPFPVMRKSLQKHGRSQTAGTTPGLLWLMTDRVGPVFPVCFSVPRRHDEGNRNDVCWSRVLILLIQKLSEHVVHHLLAQCEVSQLLQLIFW